LNCDYRLRRRFALKCRRRQKLEVGREVPSSGVNCSSIGKARDDGVRYAKGMLTVTKDVRDVRTHGFETQ